VYSIDATLIYVHIMMDEAVVPSKKPVHPQKPCTFQARAKIGSRRAFLGLFSDPVQARAPVERWERSFRVPARSARRFSMPAEVVCLEMPSIETSEALVHAEKPVRFCEKNFTVQSTIGYCPSSSPSHMRAKKLHNTRVWSIRIPEHSRVGDLLDP
jgi:hypothetical protein